MEMCFSFIVKHVMEIKTQGGGQWVHYICNTHPYLPDGHRYWEINANRTHWFVLAV